MALANKQLPPHFGKYTVTASLGEGAMGVVYKGFDPGIGRIVAIKTIRQGMQHGADTGEMAERFLNEARAAGRLNHPGIVSIYELGHQDDLAFIAMEFVEGKELSHVLAASPSLPEPLILKLMLQLLDALEYAHSHGVWHRDIKPANLIVKADGQLKVTDFGIARIESAALTQVTSTIGTPGYMAPEQYVGLKFDHRVDLFAAGVLLYRMLCAKPPFPGVAETVMYNIMNTEPQPLHELLPPELAAFYTPVVACALAKNPKDRFASAALFKAALLQRKPSTGSDDATVLVRTASASGLSGAVSNHNTGSSRVTVPIGWDAEVLAPVQAALSHFMGPLAKVLLRNTARKCNDLPTLVELLTQELANEKERAQFLFLLKQHEPKIGTGTGTQTGKGGTAVGTAFGSIRRSETENGSATIRPEALAGIANQVLVKYLGPISKIVTKRAASKARTSEQFMQLVSQDLPDDAQRSAFNKDMQAAIVAHTTATGGNG
jgi:serine/threonine protein kinase